jgi:hypothetical protein
MALNSATVSSGDLATAQQYNDLRSDVVSTSSGHVHDGTLGIGSSQFILNVSGVPLLLQNTTDQVSSEGLRMAGGNRATPADNDEVYLAGYLDDNAGTQTEFGRLTHKALDVTNTSKDSRWEFQQYTADTLREVVIPPITADDTLAVLAFAQTLTNKTINADNNTVTQIGASEIEIGIITGHSELSAGPAETDEMLISDAGTFKKINAVELLNPENFTALSAGPAETDEVFINDGGTGKKITAVELLNPENFTAVTLPAATDELFINDAGTGKKITHDDLLFGANNTPSTQAHSDSAAIGTALDAARSDHKHAMPSGGADVVNDTSPQVGGSAGFDLQAQALVGNGGTVGIKVDSVGAVNMAGQPAFSAFLTTSDLDETGDGTNFPCIMDTEEFDQGDDHVLATGVFTAPIAGRYRFTFAVALAGVTDHTDGRLQIDTTGQRYRMSFVPVDVENQNTARACATMTVFANMAASETAVFKCQVGGGGATKVVDIGGDGADAGTHFSGELVA